MISPAVSPDATTDSDLNLELRIDTAVLRVAYAQDRDTRRVAMADLEALIKQRSPAQVERMERAKGLRKAHG